VESGIARWCIFKPKIPNWEILEALGMEKVGILYAHLEYIRAIWYILWTFCNLVAISDIGQEKYGNPS
jgi:hypothetical protein